MVWADRLNSTTTTTVTKCLERWLYEFGFPKHIRTDGGPQFRGPFDDWCAENGIIHEVSSPYNPQSNGHAESAVKIAKFLIDKVDANMTQFRAHLYAWRNTPRQDGFSPSDLFFGRRQRSPKLPSLRKDACNLEAAETARSSTAAKAKEHFDKRAAPLPPLKPGDAVLLSGPGTAWGERQPSKTSGRTGAATLFCQRTATKRPAIDACFYPSQTMKESSNLRRANEAIEATMHSKTSRPRSLRLHSCTYQRRVDTLKKEDGLSTRSSVCAPCHQRFRQYA